MYNYMEAMKEDIKDYIEENDMRSEYDDPEELEEELQESLWIEDSVTGNGSGSYTFSSSMAKDYVSDNIDLCREALTEFCTESKTVADHFLNGDWEWFDVTIRCYLLYNAISEVVEEIYS